MLYQSAVAILQFNSLRFYNFCVYGSSCNSLFLVSFSLLFSLNLFLGISSCLWDANKKKEKTKE